MIRVHLSRTLRSWRPARVSIHNSFRSVSRNVSTALRPLNLDVPLCSSRGAAPRVQSLRWNSSTKEAPGDVQLNHQLSEPDASAVKEELQETDKSLPETDKSPETARLGDFPVNEELGQESEQLLDHLFPSPPKTAEGGASAVSEELHGTDESLPEHPSETAEEFMSHTILLPLTGTKKTFGSFWPFSLRDNCQCRKCINKETRQRIVDTFSISRSKRPSMETGRRR
ncbi:uncharacterized protein BDV17DRAFT_64699 [Aspergillus undulatus]|uniref:uncharacterized protein n=1 Tax=Aspergillus undulatus TaxID=1810928 RepID=UPI003CCDFAB9